MKRFHEQAVFAVHVLFALISVALLALNMVKAEAALTSGQMLPLMVSHSFEGSAVGPIPE